MGSILEVYSKKIYLKYISVKFQNKQKLEVYLKYTTQGKSISCIYACPYRKSMENLQISMEILWKNATDTFPGFPRILKSVVNDQSSTKSMEIMNQLKI